MGPKAVPSNDGLPEPSDAAVRFRLFRSAIETDKDPETRTSAARALAQDRSSEGAAALITALSDPVTSVRLEAIHALAARRDPECERAVASCLSIDVPEVRVAAATALLGAGPEAATQLMSRTSDADLNVRREVLSALIGSSLTEARAAVWSAIPSEPPDTQLHILSLPQTVCELTAIPFLKAAAMGSNTLVSEAAIRVAAKSPLPEAEQILIEALGHIRSEIRSAAAQGLANRPTEETTAALIRALSQPERAPSTAAELVKSFSRHSGRDVDRALGEALFHPQPLVVDAAITALTDRPGLEAANALLGAIAHLSRDVPADAWLTASLPDTLGRRTGTARVDRNALVVTVESAPQQIGEDVIGPGGVR
jgi:HEAT repeat protein